MTKDEKNKREDNVVRAITYYLNYESGFNTPIQSFSFGTLGKILRQEKICRDTRTIKSWWDFFIDNDIIKETDKRYTKGSINLLAFNHEFPYQNLTTLKKYLAHTQTSCNNIAETVQESCTHKKDAITMQEDSRNVTEEKILKIEEE